MPSFTDMNHKSTMQLGMIGLGRMGANMVRRLVKDGHQCVVFDQSPQAVTDLAKGNVAGTASLADLVKQLHKPRAVWLMVPAAVVDRMIADLAPLLDAGDTIIDGGNSYYIDDIRRAKELTLKGIHYVDVGTSGGVWGFERGYCMMIGGEALAVKRLDPIFATLAPGIRVNAVAPGLVDTPWTEEWTDLRALVDAVSPLQRTATPEDVAEVILGLALSTYVTGEVILVDGGLALR